MHSRALGMKILITTPLTSATTLHPAKNLSYFPNSEQHKEELFSAVRFGYPLDIWIADGKEIDKSLLELWDSRGNKGSLSLLIRNSDLLSGIRELCAEFNILVAEFPKRGHRNEAEWEEEVFRKAEDLYTTGLASEANKIVNTRPEDSSGRKVMLVGAGIVNLITAECLASNGYEVKIIDAGPDPRECCGKDWQKLGVTSSGGNARMFSFTEADNYNEKGSKIYKDMSSIFRKTVLNGGWDVKDPIHFNAAEEAWIAAFERIPPWLARIYSENIFSINKDSGVLWDKLMEEVPELFQDVELHRDILRMYVEPVATAAAKQLNKKLGALLKDTSLEEYLTEFPGFRPASQMDELAGGITVQGFTLNVHPFMANLMARIESLGGQLKWNCRIDEIERNNKGEVTALRSDGERHVSNHYVISPGIGGNDLLKGTASENVIQGVLGVWLQIPNLEPKMTNSIKIHRRGHVVEDINITVAKDSETGEDILIFGGGYGYVGLDRPADDSPELLALFDELENVASIYFPKAYEAAKAGHGFYPGGQKKYCIRPFTPTGLGVFELIPAVAGGKLIVTGGHNTGGFTQSTAVARAVWSALEGKSDPMHAWFHPSRISLRMQDRQDITVQA